MEFIPLEDDLLSLELDDVARDIYLVDSPGKSDVSSHPFVLEDLSTKLGDPRDKKNGVYQGALRRRGSYMRTIASQYRGAAVRRKQLRVRTDPVSSGVPSASRPLDTWSTEPHDVSGCHVQGAILQPEHLVYRFLKVSCRAPILNGRWERYNAMAFIVTRHVFEQG
jgi:hypothetical protein